MSGGERITMWCFINNKLVRYYFQEPYEIYYNGISYQYIDVVDLSWNLVDDKVEEEKKMSEDGGVECKWLPSYSAWLNSTRGEDSFGVYRPVVHCSVGGRALCNKNIRLVDEKLDSFAVKCSKCLKKLGEGD